MDGRTDGRTADRTADRSPISHLAKAGTTKIEMPSYKKQSGTKLDQYQPMVLIVIFMFICYFKQQPLAAILDSQIAYILNSSIQTNETASYKKHSGIKLDQFQPMVLEILSFLCLCYFSNGRWRPS